MLIKTVVLNRKTGEVIEMKVEESTEKIDYTELIDMYAEKYLKQVQTRLITP